MTDPIKYMSVTEFVRLGFLQEVNRQFLHPRGLALEVVVEDDQVRFGGIWDYRDDPDGIFFGDGVLSLEKADASITEFDRHWQRRTEMFYGSEVAPRPATAIQPLPAGETG